MDRTMMRGLNDGRTISDAAFGMFRATVEETESTSLYKVGVGGLKKSVHVEREAVEVEHATVGASCGAGGRGTEISASTCSPTRRTEVSGSLTPSSYGELLSFSSPVNHNMPNAASEFVGPCSKLSTTEISSDQWDQPIGFPENISFVLYMICFRATSSPLSRPQLPGQNRCTS